jgi:capsule polysaccharide export protein KpsE/RkpR
MQDKPLEGLLGESLRAIVSSLRRMVILCFFVAVVTSVWSLFAKPRYTAMAVTIVPGAAAAGSLSSLAGGLLSGGGMSGLGEMAAGLAGGSSEMLGLPSGVDLDVVQMVMSSDVVLQQVILKYDLMSRYRSPTMADALKKFKKRVTVTLSTSGFLIVTAQGETREEAAAIVNDIIEYSNVQLSQMVTSRARRARIQAEESLTLATDSLDAAQDQMRAFRDSTGLLFPEEQGASMMSALGTIEADMVTAQSELSGAAATLSSGSPTYREIAARVALLETAMAARLGQGDSLSFFPGYSELPGMLREYESLFLEVEMRTGVVLMLRQQLEMLRIQEARDSPTIEVLEPPTVPKLRSFPRRSILVLKVSVIAFVLSCLWITLLTYFRRVMRHPEQGRYWREIRSIVAGQIRFFRRKPAEESRT